MKQLSPAQQLSAMRAFFASTEGQVSTIRRYAASDDVQPALRHEAQDSLVRLALALSEIVLAGVYIGEPPDV